MSRSRATAKQAGSRHERIVADYLRDNFDDRIDRRVQTGAKDKGDIANVRHPHTGARVVIEAKDWGGQIKASQAITEAEEEAANDEAIVGVAVIKRKGVSDPGKQWVLTTVDGWLASMKGEST